MKNIKKIKILLLLSETWNDKLFPNNNMTNWFKEQDLFEIWTISGSGIRPYNNICKKYFLINENNMIKSFYTNIKSGEIYKYDVYNKEKINELSHNKNIKNKFSCSLIRLIREFIWRYGKINIEELTKFINDFQPDVVFSQRMGSVKMCRIEHIVQNITNAPFVAYTGDDEYSLQQISFDPFFWINKFWVRNWLKKNIPTYKLFYSMSQRQIDEYKRLFNSNMKFLVKCGNFNEEKVHTKLNNPIQIVYAGKLYCNRWKTLGIIADCIRKINNKFDKILIQLNIYTTDIITKKQNILLNDGVNSIIHGALKGNEVKDTLSKNDIVLHVESFDLKNKLATKDSFSTKIIDCMESGCAVMAVCWEKQAGYRYLKENDCAICACNENEIYNKLLEISNNSKIITEYAQKAYICGIKNHQRKSIQEKIYYDLKNLID